MPVRAPAARRRLRAAGLVALAAGAAYVAVGIACFVLPHDDPLPAHADVAFALGDTTPQRIATAMDLLHRGRVGAVQLSLAGSAGPGTAIEAAERLCDADARVHCARPDPSTTQGEARMLHDAAAQHGWRSAILITQNAQLLRGRWIVSRCFTGPIALRASGEPPQHGWPWEFAYQTLATVKNLLVTPGC